MPVLRRTAVLLLLLQLLMVVAMVITRRCHHTRSTTLSYHACRDAEVLSLFATIINKLQAAMEREVPRIFESVFEVTLTMITKNFEVRASLAEKRDRCV